MIKTVKLHNWKTHSESTFEFGKGTNVLVGPMGSGKSLPYGELVLVKEGHSWKKEAIGKIVERSLKNAEEIQKQSNGTIFTSKNPFNIRIQTVDPCTLKMEERKISKFIKHKAEAEVIKIRTRQGKEITVTPNHSLLVFENGELKPIKGSDVKKGVFILCPKKMELKCSPEYFDVSAELPDFRETNDILGGLQLIKEGVSVPKAASQVSVTKFTLANWRDRKRSHERNLIIAKHLSHAVPKKIKLSKNFARICGAYVSEGGSYYLPKKSQYKLCITNDDKLFLRTFETAWKSVFPKIPIKRIKNNSQINSKIVSALFSRLFGAHAGEKKLPEFVFWFNDELLSDFFKMYFEGDGYISTKRAELSCSSKSIELLEAIQTLLCRWGIISRLRKVKRKQGEYYELLVLPKHIPIFARHVSFLSKRKQTNLLKWVKVLEKRNGWDGVDIIPNIENLLKELTYEYSLGKRKNKKMRNIASQLFTYRTKENIGREKLSRILGKILENYKFKTPAFEKLEKIVKADIFFDRVTKIERIPTPSKYVYDFSVEETENFVAGLGNILTHNSSVMDAICFALFGTFPALQARRLALQEIIQNKPNQADDAGVELEFDYAGKQYSVERTIKKKGSSEAKLYCQGKFIAGPKPRDVTAAIERAIEINYNLFSRAVYSEQNEIDYFLRLTPRERKQRFDELLDLRKYETVRANAVTVENTLKRIAKDRKALLQEQLASLREEDEAKLRKRIEEKERESRDVKKKIEETEKRVEGLEREVKFLESKGREFNSLREQLMQKKARAEELSKAIEETRKQAKGKTKLELEKERRELGQKAGEKELALKQLEEEERELEREKSEAEKVIGVNQAKENELKEHLLQLQGLKAVCPVCKRKLETATREELVAENKAGQKRAREEREKAEKIVAGVKEKLDKAAEKRKKLGKEKEALHENLVELKHLGEKIEVLGEKGRELKQLQEIVETVEKQIKAIGFDEKELQQKRKEVVEGKAAVEGAKQGIKANDELVREFRERLEKIEKNRQQLKALQKKIASIESNVEKMNYFNNALQAAQSELRETLIGTINQAMQNIWQKIYPYKDFKTAKMAVEQGSYELRVLDNRGNWVRVEGILSGGERSAAAICIRIAFSLVLTQNLSWLILDEPTHNLDSNAVSTLSKMMQLHLPDLVDQIFVITHDNEMRKAASGNLYVLERDKDKNGTTKPVLVPNQG